MNYLLIADLVMMIHALLIISVFFGIFISFKMKKFRPIESFILISAIVVWSLYNGCPLTYIEDHFRNLAGTPIDLLGQGFIPYYINHFFDTDITARNILTATYILSGLFLLLSIDWLAHFFHFKRIMNKARRIIGA